MRLTIRCLLSMMTAVESGLDEVCNVLRNEGEKSASGLHLARRRFRESRQALRDVLDEMINSGHE